MNRYRLWQERLRKRLIRWTGGKTVGVRAIVLDARRRVLLVRHTYRPGWHLPGGGVDAAEAPEAAVVRELHEETGIRVDERPQLLAVYLSKHQGVDDYPLLYLVTRFRIEPCRANAEIAELAWFALDALPVGTTDATRRRIREYVEAIPPTVTWLPGQETPSKKSGLG